MKQDQFLTVVDRDEAERRFRAALDLRPLPAEDVPLHEALHRVLAQDVIAPVDVPSFDRSNMDGFAVRAADTFGASEDQPRRLRLGDEVLTPGMTPTSSVEPGLAVPIATGAMVPRGADAVVMIEHTDAVGAEMLVRRPVAPGANISGAGTDIGRGETVLRQGELLTSRETGVLAAIGVDTVRAVRRPLVAIISTGNELIPPGAAMAPGQVYDSNRFILADAVRELGAEPVPLGIVPDNLDRLRAVLGTALAFDVVLLSGGTSKGEGDLSYRAVAELGPPGILVHGVALKPGKPICLAAVRVADKTTSERVVPVVILPGFPTSAIFTFHEFVAPVIRALAGRLPAPAATVTARVPLRVNSERGRTEYFLVNLVHGAERETKAAELVAYPMGKGSGSVTTFSRADGFVIIPRQHEYLEADTQVEVQLLGQGLRPADLVVIGSHCVAFDYLLSVLHERGFRSKFLAVGSTGGLEAAKRGECDIAGIHLLDEASGEYNRPFLTPGLRLVPGYRRMQGIVFRQGDKHFAVEADITAAIADRDCIMINRNRGSGTRMLIDRLLQGRQPGGYSLEARSHNAVAAAVVQGRADWGVAIEIVARQAGLGFIQLQEEEYDFVLPDARANRTPTEAFLALLQEPRVRAGLKNLGFVPKSFD